MNLPVLESDIYQLRLEPLSWEHFTDLETACAEGDLGKCYITRCLTYINLNTTLSKLLNSSPKVKEWLLP